MGFVKYQHLERFGRSAVRGIEVGECFVFSKVDGTNASVWLENGEIKAGSRNRELSHDKDNAGFYKQIVDDINIKSYLNKYPEHRLYGEFLVPHSLKTYEDDAWRKFYVFDICVGGEGDLEYIPYKEYQPILEKFDIDYIPCIATIQDGDFHTFKEYLDTNTYLIQSNKGTGEGLVIKNYNFKNRFGRTVWAKIVCDEFKVKHTETFGESDSEPKKMVEELIVDKFCTDAFIEKEYSKIVHENDGEFEGRDIPRLLNTVWHEFIVEESWNFIKQHRNPTIDYKTLNGLVIDKIKKVKSNEF